MEFNLGFKGLILLVTTHGKGIMGSTPPQNPYQLIPPYLLIRN